MLKSILGLAAAAALVATVFTTPMALADSDHGMNGHEAGDCGTYGYWSEKLHKCLDARNK
jgi:hypothetical protein